VDNGQPKVLTKTFGCNSESWPKDFELLFKREIDGRLGFGVLSILLFIVKVHAFLRTLWRILNQAPMLSAVEGQALL